MPRTQHGVTSIHLSFEITEEKGDRFVESNPVQTCLWNGESLPLSSVELK